MRIAVRKLLITAESIVTLTTTAGLRVTRVRTVVKLLTSRRTKSMLKIKRTFLNDLPHVQTPRREILLGWVHRNTRLVGTEAENLANRIFLKYFKNI